MWSVVSRIFTTNRLIALACLLIIAYLLPYYILGEDTHIRLHDNLDSNIVWYKMLSESGMIFSLPDSTLPQVINGLPRSALASGLDGAVWLYVLFEPFTAYTISQTIMRFVAFLGMYVLLKRDVLRDKDEPIISVGVALGFAMLPYWPSGALSIAGLPLALHIFLTIKRDGTHTPKRYWVYLFLMTFFSSFILTFVFFLGLMGLWWLIDWIKTKQFNPPFFWSIAGMTTIYLLKNYMLLYSMFIDSGFTSHRDEMNLGHKNFPEAIELFWKNFIESHTHVLDLHGMIILPTVVVAFFIAIYSKRNVKPLIGLFIFNAIFSLIYALWYWEGTRILKDHISLFNTFNFGRIHFLRPLLWYMMFAIALWIICRSFRFGKAIVIVLIVLQCSILFYQTEQFKYSRFDTPTFKEFYATELFDDIDDYIGKDKQDYRVVSIAMHPTIAQYNGFYTLDTYNNSFPLDYKHEFRKIIEPELKKNKSLESYFDTWGGRLYMYVGKLGENYVFTKDSEKTIEDLDINVDQLKNMGGEYILSALPIENYNDIGLSFNKSFEHPETKWKIYLYQVK